MDDRPFPVRSVKRLHTEDRGFGMVETVAAMGILFVALTILAFTALVGFKDAGAARQRQAADGIVDKLMEEVRSLSYATISKGLSDSDLASDSNIRPCGNKYNYKSCSGEEIVHTTGLPTTVPLVPHQGTYGTADGYPTTYNWSVYVTKASDAPSAGGYRVRVVVTWSSSQRASATSISTESLVFQPKGTTDSDSQVVSTTGAFFFGQGTITRGNIVITPNTSSQNPTGINGVPSWTSLRVDLPALDSSVQQEQLANISTSSTDIGGKYTYGSTSQTVGERSAINKADDDSTTSALTYATNSYSDLDPSSAVNCSAPSTPWNCLYLWAFGSSSSSGNAISTTAAGGSNACNGQADSRPCSYGKQTQGYDLSVYLDMRGGNPTNTLSFAPIVYVGRPVNGASVQPESVYGRRLVVSGDGIVRQTVTRALGGSVGLYLGDLPLASNNKPSRWLGAWIYTSSTSSYWSPSAQVEAGTNASSPTITWPASAYTLNVWNGNGYTAINYPTTGNPTTAFTICSSGCTYSITPLNYCWKANNTLSYKFTINGSFSVGSSYTTRSPSTGNTINDAKAVIGSPLAGSMDYTIFQHGGSSACNSPTPTRIADLHFAVDLGQVVAHAVYTPAP